MPNTLVVRPGVAIDAQGRALLVAQERRFDPRPVRFTSPLFNGHDQSDGRRVHLLLNADSLRDAVILKDEVLGFEAVEHAAG